MLNTGKVRVESVNEEFSSLIGKFLIAMPGMSDARFERSVIFICAHSSSVSYFRLFQTRFPFFPFPLPLLERAGWLGGW